jgi:hypothetical protein
MPFRRNWAFSQSTAVCTIADRQLEEAIHSRLERGQGALFSSPGSYGLVSIWKNRNHTVEQNMPFDADELVAKTNQWAGTLKITGLPKGWSPSPDYSEG